LIVRPVFSEAVSAGERRAKGFEAVSNVSGGINAWPLAIRPDRFPRY
jgi:rhodanese-related sulfurtransferase